MSTPARSLALLALALVLPLTGCISMPTDGPVVTADSEGSKDELPVPYIDPPPPEVDAPPGTSSPASSTR